MTDKKSAVYENIFLAILVSAVWALCCAGKGVFPFGEQVLSVGDMREQSIPVYTFLWDVLHGSKSLFFDWDIGLGNNMAGVVSHFTLISPFNLFLLFIERSAVETSMFWFFLCKIVAIALGVRFVFRKWFPGLDRFLLYAFCILYVFCPFLAEYYRVPSWYDIAFLFPFVMYFYVEMMRGRGRGIGYTLSLAAMAVMSFQHTFMLAILLVLMTGGLLAVNREKYGSLMLRWIMTSLLAALLSACILLPGVLQIMTAGRLDGNFDLMEIMESIYIFFPSKWFKLVNLGIPFGMLLCAGPKIRKDRRLIWLVYVDMMLFLPIALESTNVLWHGGPYEGYTMRFSYMGTFWALVTGLYCHRETGEKKQEKTAENAAMQGGKPLAYDAMQGGKSRRGTMLFRHAAFTVVLLLLGFVLYHMAVRKTSIVFIVLIVVLSMMLGGNLFRLKGVGYGRGILFASVIISIAVLDHNIIIQYNTDNSNVRFYNMIRETEKEADRKPLDRIKNMDIESQNYPQLLHRSAIGNYTASEGYEQIYSTVDMGYALVGNRMSDWGGTVFSDALLGITETITAQEPDGKLYTEKTAVSAGDEYHIYDCNYVYENGILVRRDWDMSVKGNGNPFALQEEMAESILGNELFTLYEMPADTLDITLEEEGILYGYVPGVPAPTVTVNTIEITDTETGETVERPFTSGWDNGMIQLGIYEGQKLHVRVERAEDIGTMYFAVLPLAKLEEYEPVYAQNFQYTTSGHSLNATLTDAEKGDRLFLPIYHDAGWKCRVNGRSVAIETFLSGGMVIPLMEGDNDIRLRYYPPGFMAGVLGSLLGGVLFIIFWRFPALETAIVEKLKRVPAYLVFGVWSVLMVVFYLLPFVFLARFLVRWVLHG